MKSTVVSLVFGLGLALGGCGSAAQYVLPYPVARATETFPFIAAAAGEMNLQAVQHPSSINVRMDGTTWIQFMAQMSAYNMVILVDKSVPPDQLQAKFAAAKGRGDAIWARAMELMRGMPGGRVVLAPPPVAVAPVAAVGSWCHKLSLCYSAIANSLCAQATDASCRNTFTVRLASDEGLCHQAVVDVPTITMPYQALLPGWQIPAECR